MFTIAEPYDAPVVFLYHNPQHHSSPLPCPHLYPSHVPISRARQHNPARPRPPLANVPRHQQFSTAPRTTRIHTANADRGYRDTDTGQPVALTGPLQIVFCDRGTPSTDPHQFSIYQAIKDELTARGMAPERIRFIHDARKPAEVKALFAQCDRGEVSVLIGSTEKMGTGTNVQSRAIALHHVDVPWRPADLEQREGRIIRQGNQNQVVEILNYVTEFTYDTVMWQKVQAKALFIEQMRRNEVLDTEIEDLSGGDIGSAAAETKAVATGDPRYLRQVELEDDVKRLTALERAHQESVRRRDWRVTTHERSLPAKQQALDRLKPIAEQAASHTESGAPSPITVASTTHTDRSTAADALAAACRHAFIAGKDRGAAQFIPIGACINGVDILAAHDLTHDMLLLRLAVPSRITELKHDELMATAGAGEPAAHKARGLLRRVENLYSGLPAHHQMLRGELDRDRAELDDMLANPPGPFEHASALADKQAELAALMLELRLAAESPEALAKAAAANQRMTQRGRKPGWSLLLNPTPTVLAELGYPSAESLRRAIRAQERIAREHHRGRDLDTPGHEPEL
jgi:hypothetical protein